VPGWPNIGRADERELIEALRESDPNGPAALYDAFADRLTDYATSLLRDPDTAAEAVHDTIVAACGGADRLRDPGRLRAWLYALTRFQCAARSRGRRSIGITGHIGAGGADHHANDYEDDPLDGYRSGRTDVQEDPGDPGLPALVREVLGELGAHEREVLVLAVRHGLSTAEVGTVLGLTSRQVDARLTRSRDHLENAAATLVLAGRAHCPGLSAMVGSSGPPGPRKRLARHIAACEVCTEQRHRQVRAERLLDLLPVMYAPLSLRRRVTEDRAGPGRGTAVLGVAFDQTGFPITSSGRRETRHRRPRRRLWARRIMLAMGAAVCVAAITGAVVAMAARGAGNGHERAFPTPAKVPAPPDIPTPAADPATPRPTRTGHTKTGHTKTGHTKIRDTKTRHAPSRPPATPATTVAYRRSPTPVARHPRRQAVRLAVACPGDLGATHSATITLRAVNAVVEWRATTTGGLRVRPAHGVLKAGAHGRVTVSAGAGDAGSGVITFGSAGGGASCAITWDGRADKTDAPPGDPNGHDPAGDPGPSGNASAEPSRSASEIDDATSATTSGGNP